MSAKTKTKEMRADVFQVFCAYQGMEHRSLEKLSKIVGVPYSTLRTWSSKYGWRDKVRAFDADVQKRSIEAATVDIVQIRANQLRGIRKGVDSLLAIIGKPRFGGKMTQKDIVSATRELVTLDRLLSGESTENTSVTKSHEDALDELE